MDLKYKCVGAMQTIRVVCVCAHVWYSAGCGMVINVPGTDFY
jgi:hypothetical protein